MPWGTKNIAENLKKKDVVWQRVNLVTINNSKPWRLTFARQTLKMEKPAKREKKKLKNFKHFQQIYFLFL